MNRQRRRQLVFLGVTVLLMLALVDVSLSLLLRLSLLPAAMSSAVHGTSLYTRLVADTLPTREPNLDVTYTVDRERFGDLVKKGLVAPDSPSGDGVEQVRLRTDRLGFRSVESHDACDVVILGDSVTEASNLGEDAPYPLRLDRGLPLRICNVSIAAVGTLQQRDHLRRSGLPRDPRLVVLAFFEGNDLQDNVNFTRIRERQRDESFVRRFLRRRPLLRLGRSAVQSLSGNDSDDAGPAPDLNPLRGRLGDTDTLMAFNDSYTRRLSRSTDEIESSEGWQLTRKLLTEIHDDCRAAGVPLLVAFFPSKPHVYRSFLLETADLTRLQDFASDRTDESPEAFAARLERNGDALRNLLRDTCHEQDIGFLDLLPALEAAARSGRKVFLSYDTHLNAAGHEVTADVLEPELTRRLAAPSP